MLGFEPSPSHGCKSDTLAQMPEACFYAQNGKLNAIVRHADVQGATISVCEPAAVGSIGLLVYNGIKVPATVLQAVDEGLELAFDSPLSGWRAESFLGRSNNRHIVIHERDSAQRLAA